MGTAIVSLTRQPIMIQQKQKTKEEIDDLNDVDFYDDPKFRELFPPIRTKEDFAAYIKAGEKGPFMSYEESLRDLRKICGYEDS